MSLRRIGFCNGQRQKSSFGQAARRARAWRVEASASGRRIFRGVAASVTRLPSARLIAAVSGRLPSCAPGVADFACRRFVFRPQRFDTLLPNKSFKPTAFHAAA